ncbi:MAG: NUDIX hydrolase [Candidatus Uhrbacteria bacterium]|nr:NUDIX hydrolase [Candidatus Uhrbacteria bacterium]MDP3793450.1 NUDIX hydrolase [Candidatus Uhrbacteria bacterium]
MLWTKVTETPFRAGFRPMLTRHFQLPDGRVEEFTIKDERPVVCILPLTEDQRIILVKQYRPGPERMLLELPGGGIERDEAPEVAARRELLEETGYDGEFIFVGITLDCAYSTMQRYNFVAKNCRKIQEPHPDANEFLEVMDLNLQEFRSHLRSGEMTDVEVGYLCLDVLNLL